MREQPVDPFDALDSVSAVLYGLMLAMARAREQTMRRQALTSFTHADLIGRVDRLRSAVEACKVDDGSDSS